MDRQYYRNKKKYMSRWSCFDRSEEAANEVNRENTCFLFAINDAGNKGRGKDGSCSMKDK